MLAGALAAGPTVAPPAGVDWDVRRDAAVAATEQAMPSVVNIRTSRIVEYSDFYDPIFREFFGLNGPTRRREELNSIGSGVIIDEEGYVLTNVHVLRRATRVQVQLSDGRVYDAKPIVGETDSDVALLKFEVKPGEPKPKAIRMAKDDDVLLGETVLALGNPYGLGASVSRGILSSKDRRPASDNEPLRVENWLQTDASINPGNSGGPLIDLRGELIGINVAVYREEQGMGVGFAIPVKQVNAALAQFFAPEVTDSLWFGARLSGGTPPLNVSFVQTGSPAEKAGLRIGQSIVSANGKPVRSLVEFNRLVTAHEDHTVTLVVDQNGERRRLQAQLVPFDQLIRQKLGLGLLNLTLEVARGIGLQAGAGLFIDDVEKGSPAANAKLQRGLLLMAVDDRATAGADGLRIVADVLSSKKTGETVQLSVLVPQRVGNSYGQFQQAQVSLPVR